MRHFSILALSALTAAGNSLLADPLFQELRTPPTASSARYPSLKPLTKADGNPPRSEREWRAEQDRYSREWKARIGPFPKSMPLETEVLETEELSDHRRLRLRYRIDRETETEAYLLLPNGYQGKRPGMVVLHATSNSHMRDAVGLGGRESVHLALHLVRRGYVCIAPRNFLWGEPSVAPPTPAAPTNPYQRATEKVLQSYQTGMARMTWDAIRATDVLAARSEVDPERLGSIGHSLGAKEVVYHAAFDRRIRAAISCEGGIGIGFSNWEADWYLGRQVKSAPLGTPQSTDHHELLTVIAPRAFLLIGGGSADGAQSWPYIEAALPAYRARDAEPRLGLLVHAQGHNFPSPGPERERVWAWLDHWLLGK